MNLLEKELEDAIYEATDEQLKERGLVDVVEDGIILRLRQTFLGDEAGRSDLIFVTRKHFGDSFDSVLRINIIELKRDKVGSDALLQAVRYANAVKTYMDLRKFDYYDIKITLIGQEIKSDNSFMFLPNLVNRRSNYLHALNEINAYSFRYMIDGIQFCDEHIGYSETKTDKFMKGICLKSNQQNPSEQDGLPF